METERELLFAIRDGEPQAMRRLYDRFSGYTMAIALRYVPEHDDAKDIVQDGFIKIIDSIDKFDYRGEGSLKRWVARIITNVAIDRVKTHERMHQTFEHPDVMPDKDGEDPPEMEEVPPDILNKLIGRLPSGCRVVLNLYVYEQYSHVEIARRLGIQPGTSASQLSYAKRLLKKMIQDYLDSQRI